MSLYLFHLLLFIIIYIILLLFITVTHFFFLAILHIVLNGNKLILYRLHDHVCTKASELVPCRLLPHWNSMWFFVTGSLYDSNSVEEVKFATCTGEVRTRDSYCNLYVNMLWLDHVLAGAVKFPKSWLWTLLLRQKIHHFFFSHIWGARFRYLPEVCPTCSFIQLYT